MSKSYWVYILTSSNSTTLYIGITNDIERRMGEHKSGKVKGFSKRYKLNRLIYVEEYEDISEALSREKQLKSWKREWKEDLINSINPKWKDLSKEL